MALDSDEVVVGATGLVRVAPIGTAIPASISVAYAAGWVDLGFVSEDGVSWTDGKSTSPIRAWQSFYDIRTLIESREGTLSFNLLQWNRETVELAFGGGTWTEEIADTDFKYVPPPASTVDERMLAVDWLDGVRLYRLIFARGIVTENVETNLVRTSAAELPISFSLLGSDSGDPWELHTNDPVFDAP